jgi:hypothetical protein
VNHTPTQAQRINAETLWVISDPSGLYSIEDIYGLLKQAAGRGISLGCDSPLEHLTLGELDTMLNGRPRYAV